MYVLHVLGALHMCCSFRCCA